MLFLTFILETFSSDIHDKLINVESMYYRTVVFIGELFETTDGS